MQVADNTVVSIDYTVMDENQNVIDSSQGREPLQYVHGAQNIVPGLENALAGRTTGEELEVVVPPEEGYGERDEQLVQDVPKQMFEGVEEIQPGMQFRANTPAGPRLVTVAQVKDDAVTVDANHPLAGQTLHFKVAVRDVREVTPEDTANGQPQA